MQREITQELLQSIFDYDEITGTLWYKTDYKTKAGRKSKKAATCASVSASNDYPRVGVPGFGPQKLHRMVFLYHRGYLPIVVDHDDRDKHNSCIENLIDSDLQKNALNQPIRKNNKTGVTGVSLLPSGKYKVQFRGVGYGTYTDFQQAIKVNQEVRKNYLLSLST